MPLIVEWNDKHQQVAIYGTADSLRKLSRAINKAIKMSLLHGQEWFEEEIIDEREYDIGCYPSDRFPESGDGSMGEEEPSFWDRIDKNPFEETA